jgi:hypothetical protein
LLGRYFTPFSHFCGALVGLGGVPEHSVFNWKKIAILISNKINKVTMNVGVKDSDTATYGATFWMSF